MPGLESLLTRVERYSGPTIAIRGDGGDCTYSEVTAIARRLAGFIMGSEGFGRPVAILDFNSRQYLETYFACALAGVPIVPLNTRLAAAELSAILAEVQPQLLLVGPALADLASTVTCAAPVISTLALASLSPSAASTGPAPRPESQPAAIYYTSGTTGRPKGVCLSEAALVASIHDGIYAMAMQPTDVWLHAAPMFHLADAAMIWAVTAAGAGHVFQRFEPAGFARLVKDRGVTCTSLPPTLINMIVNSPGLDPTAFSSLRRISFGGSPMPGEVFRRARAQLRCELFQAFGATETAGFICCAMPGDGVSPGETIGRPVPSLEVRALDADGREAACGEVGELVVRGVKVMDGYLGQPEATAEAVRDGWYHTGDLGRQDAAGLFYITGRKKDMIITGGENVYAVEVENCLADHPAVYEAAVFGTPDPLWGERVTAVVALRPAMEADEDLLKTWCRERLAAYKVPKTLVVSRTDLPKSGPGKIAKHLLKEGLSWT